VIATEGPRRGGNLKASGGMSPTTSFTRSL
jgi:hypothetical protein